MIKKKLEILKSGTWHELEFYHGQGLKYNNVINKISNTTERSLSHSNTFELPFTKKNIDALDINVFNQVDLANALNEKYEAKYYIDGELTQQGYVVINNMHGGTPSLNFIDEALSLIELWGSTTYKEFIQDDVLVSNLSSAYQTRISEMKDYDMTKTSVLVPLSDISGETFPIAYFPNNINPIGDKFQSDSDENRIDGNFNPFQSRPLFNAKAFLNMVTTAYGYDLVENESIDWERIATTVISADNLTAGEVDEGTQTYQYDTVYTVGAHWSEPDALNPSITDSQASMVFPEAVGIAPSSLTNFPTNPDGIETPATDWFTERRLFVPDVSGDYSGTVTFNAQHTTETRDLRVKVVYEDTSTANAYIIEDVTLSADNSTGFLIEVEFDKAQFETPTDPDAGTLVGIYLATGVTSSLLGPVGMLNMTATEEVLSPDVVTFDDYGQYEQANVDLTYNTPTKTIKEIINGILQAFGALIEIDHENTQVELFTYDYYITLKEAGDFVNWSSYLQEYMSPNFNTDYGNNYAIKNKIGLADPFLGNTTEKYIGNQTTNSKYKEFATNYNTQFKDVTRLIVVTGTGYSYDEYSISGASLLTYDYTETFDFTQTNFEKDNQPGTITDIPFIKFFDMSIISNGLDTWYNLIDEAVRASPTFLLPQSEIRNLDIKRPVYIGHLGGFYIIEEIVQYQDETIPVSVKLIKIPVSLNAASYEGLDPIESIIAFYGPGEFFTNTNYFIYSSTTFNGYTPTSATMHAIQYTNTIANGGTATGVSYSEPLTLGSYTNDIMTIDFGDSLDSSESGWFQVYIEDQDGETSEIVEVYAE